MSRDDVASDKVDVLAEYWHASLQAKVLLMLCGSTKNLPPPPASGPTKQSQTVPSLSPRRNQLTGPPSPQLSGRNSVQGLGASSSLLGERALPSLPAQQYQPYSFRHRSRANASSAWVDVGVGTKVIVFVGWILSLVFLGRLEQWNQGSHRRWYVRGFLFLVTKATKGIAYVGTVFVFISGLQLVFWIWKLFSGSS